MKKSISKKDFQVKKFIFSPPAPKCTFDRSGGRRVRVFCTSSVRCDAGFDFFGSERAKGSRKTHLEFVADLKAREGFDFLARGLAWRRRVRNFRRAWRATENLEKYLAQQFDFQKRFSIQSGEYDRLEFYGTDQLERGPRFEAPFQKCVRLTRFKFCQSATDRHRGSEFWHGWPKGSTFSCLFPTRRRL